MSRFKNYGFLIAMASLIGLIVNDMGLMSPEDYKRYVDVILTVLVAAGITNDPTSGKWFKDNKKGQS